MYKKANMGLLLLGFLFLISVGTAIFYFSQEGYIPDEALGQNELRLLSLKEEAVSTLLASDQAIKFSAYESYVELADKSLVLEENCPKHLYTIINGNCSPKPENFVNLLTINYYYYINEFNHQPSVEFSIVNSDGFTEGIAILAEAKKELIISETISTIPLSLDYIFNIWPSSTTILTGCYNKDRIVDGVKRPHYGMDVSGSNPDSSAANVIAVADGKVQSVCKTQCNTKTGSCQADDEKCAFDADNECISQCGNYGSNVVILHRTGFLTQYNHLDPNTINVEERQEVVAGNTIAQSGNTGYSAGRHLDFKVYTSLSDLNAAKNAQNPFCYLSADATQGIVFASTADSCTNKYGSEFNSNHPGVIESCINSAAASLDESKIPDDAFERSLGYDEIIGEAAAENEIPPALIKALITQESKFDNNARSPTGPYGSLQLTAVKAEEIGLERVTACCTTADASKNQCREVAACTAENDDRPYPDREIPKAAVELGKYWTDFNQNLEVVAVAWNAGRGVAFNMMEECPEGVTPENADECAKDAGKEFSVYQGRTQDGRNKWEAKYEDEVQPYMKNVRTFYEAWGGVRSTIVSTGSYYSSNPSAKIDVDLNLEPIDIVNEFVTEVETECTEPEEYEECIKDTMTDFNRITTGKFTNQIPSTCHPGKLDLTQNHGVSDNEFNNFANFVMSWEQCRAYNWEELNVSDACLCNIQWPETGFDVKIMPDRIQAVKGGKVIYEHYTDVESAKVDIGGEVRDWPYIFNNRLRPDIIVDEKGQEITRRAGTLPISRNETHLILMREGEGICEAHTTLFSFCYDTEQTIPQYTPETDKYGLKKVIIPFSIKLD